RRSSRPSRDADQPSQIFALGLSHRRHDIAAMSPLPLGRGHRLVPEAGRPSESEWQRLKAEAMARAGLPWSEHNDFELDHVVPRWLDGRRQRRSARPAVAH
ncbi:MAG TPA: hypothetical protein VGF39_04800, partial [Stellaceae bacterium]